MRSTRLFSPLSLSANTEIALGQFEANYVARVLRLKPGDALTVFDGSGGEFRATIQSASKRELSLKVGDFRERDIESPLRTTLVQGLSKGERMDIVVQKATELGVTRIVPVTTRHSQFRFSTDRAESRFKHWRGIAANACQQCGRNRLPEIARPAALEQWLAQQTRDSVSRVNAILIPGAEPALPDLAETTTSVSLVIGPEGGLAAEEIQLATDAGFVSAGLGPRVLRTETAALVALAQVQSVWGDL